MRTFTPICFLIALLWSAGCRSASVVPEGWAADVSAAAIADDWRPEAQVQRDRAPRLQVFIHYNHTHSTHAAVRVTAPGRPAIFWDPGGGYGVTTPAYGRTHDVILDAPPDLPTWWNYRQRWLNEPLLYIFEWDLDASQAHAMRNAMLDGAAHGREARVLQTRITPGFCVYAVGDFLRTYGPPRISPNLRRNFWPNSLARQLWRQNPDRVLRYEGDADATPVVLTYIGSHPGTEADDLPLKAEDAEAFPSVALPRDAVEARRSIRDASPGL